jgi:hypothetical protein
VCTDRLKWAELAGLITFILWQSVLLVEETGLPGGNHPHATSHCQALLHNVVKGLIRAKRHSENFVFACLNNPIFLVGMAYRKCSGILTTIVVYLD